MFHNRYSIKCPALNGLPLGHLFTHRVQRVTQARENSEEDLLDILTVNEPLRYMGSGSQIHLGPSNLSHRKQWILHVDANGPTIGAIKKRI